MKNENKIKSTINDLDIKGLRSYFDLLTAIS